MATDVEICNLALFRLGDEAILNFAEGTTRAALCAAHYTPAVDNVTREGQWKFARRRAVLAELLPTPPFEWGHRYALPTDPYCLQALYLLDSFTSVSISTIWGRPPDNAIIPWTVEGRELLTDMSPAHLVYTARVPDTGLFPGDFVECLATYLAGQMAYAVTGNSNVEQAKMQEYDLLIQKAKHANGREGSPYRATLNTTFLDVRRGY